MLASARVTIENPVSGYRRETTTDGQGHFQFTNVPLNPYHLIASAEGFASIAEDVDVRSLVPVNVTAKLKPAAATETITVEGRDLIESDPTFHHAHTNRPSPMSKRIGAAQRSSTRIDSMPRQMIATLMSQKMRNATSANQ